MKAAFCYVESPASARSCAYSLVFTRPAAARFPLQCIQTSDSPPTSVPAGN